MSDTRYKIVYCTPAIYSAGGTERVVTAKANYFADCFGYDVTIIVTEGRGRESFFPLSEKVKVVNLGLCFEELWNTSFLKKSFLYLRKQRCYRKRLTQELQRIKPDITISTLRREINFLSEVNDGSLKIGEMHLNRYNFRNFEPNDFNPFKGIFAKLWMGDLVNQLSKLDRLVVLTEKSRASWPELSNVEVIPDPLPFEASHEADLSKKRVITIGRYAYQKGYDLLLRAWTIVEKECPGWQLQIFGMGDTSSYSQLMSDLSIDQSRCHLNGPVDDAMIAYQNSSIFVLSSRFEGFGLVLIEAMSCGLPVVSFNCPYGPDEIISDGENGLLAPAENVEALAEKMKNLMHQEDQRRRLASNAQKTAENYKMSIIARKWQMLFDELMHTNEV